MTAYIVRKGAQKKRGILEKREETLRHHIRNASADMKLGPAAEEVRLAQLAVIKCLLHEIATVKSDDELRVHVARERLEAQAQQWRERSVAEIIGMYR